jgi:hypothetical protein
MFFASLAKLLMNIFYMYMLSEVLLIVRETYVLDFHQDWKKELKRGRR